MKGLAIASRGTEDICALEIKELIKAKTAVKKGCVVFDFKKYEDLCLLCYKAQSLKKVLFLFDNFKISKLKESIEKIDFKKWLTKKTTFRVSSFVVNNEISSEEFNGKIGEIIINYIKDKSKYRQKVDLDNPDLTVFAFLNKNDCYLGIDFSGFNLYKRTYKVFNCPISLRGTIGYTLVRLGDFKENETLLDPFCGSGVIPIEAALFASGKAVNYFNKDKFSFLRFNLKIDFEKMFKKFDYVSEEKVKISGYDSKLMNVSASKKNAKIAGVHKMINFSRIDVEWLDTKRDKGSVDKIVSHVPELTRHVNPKDIEKTYNELFHQAEFVLKKNGRIALISRESEMLKEIAEKYKFKILEERDVYSGKQVLKVIVFGK